MVTEDCNCRIPRGHVKAQRVSGGTAAGRWGTVRVGGWAIVPRSVVDANPEFWRVKGEDPPVAPEDPGGMSALELAAEARRGGMVPQEDGAEEP